MLHRFFGWLSEPRFRLLKAGLVLALILAAALALRWGIKLAGDFSDPRSRTFLIWGQGDSAERAALVTVQRDACPGAPFILPADGYIGLLYADPRGPYSNSNPHQGIEISSNSDPGLTLPP